MRCLLLSLLVTIACVQASYDGNFALYFDGVDDLVTCAHTYWDDILDDFWTLEAWVNPSSDQFDWQLNFFGYPGRHPNLELCGANDPQCAAGQPLTQLRELAGQYYTIAGTKLTTDTWHHLAATWDNHTLSLYIDGKLDVTTTPYTNNYVEARPCVDYNCDAGLQIGGFRLRTTTGLYSAQYYHGLIDEVRVWQVGRTAAQIQATMSTTLSGDEQGLVYYYTFDEGSGPLITSQGIYDGYGLLGAGNLSAEPKFTRSNAPITSTTVTHPVQTIIERESSGAVIAGALLSLFFLFGGITVGLLLGWKLHERKSSGLRMPWETRSLLRGDSSEHEDELGERTSAVGSSTSSSSGRKSRERSAGSGKGARSSLLMEEVMGEEDDIEAPSDGGKLLAH